MNWADSFGIIAFALHLIAYGLYAQQVWVEKVKPNVATWFMWLFGGIIEWQTYDHMVGAHWSTSLLPFACVLGLGAITFAIFVSQARERWRGTGRQNYHKPLWYDWWLVGFDVAALFLWFAYDLAEWANVLAVSTTIVTFVPIWRTTWQEPGSERAVMWLIWCVAYFFMLASLLSRGGDNLWWQGFYPVYYFVLHFVVAILALRVPKPQTFHPAE